MTSLKFFRFFVYKDDHACKLGTMLQVRWKEDEWKIVLDSVRKLAPSMCMAKAYKAAATSELLAPHRRRNVSNMGGYGVPTLKRMRQAYEEGIKLQFESGEPPKVVASPQSTPEATPEATSQAEVKSIPAMVHIGLKQARFDDLLVELSSRVISEITRFSKRIESIETILRELASRPVIQPASPESHVRSVVPIVPPAEHRPRTMSAPKSPKCLIVGLLKDQFDNVVKKIGGQLPWELVWADKDDRAVILPQSVDWAVVQRHTNHRWCEVLRDKLGNKHVAFADGGISSVVQKLYDLHSMRVAEKIGR